MTVRKTPLVVRRVLEDDSRFYVMGTKESRGKFKVDDVGIDRSNTGQSETNIMTSETRRNS